VNFATRGGTDVEVVSREGELALLRVADGAPVRGPSRWARPLAAGEGLWAMAYLSPASEHTVLGVWSATGSAKDKRASAFALTVVPYRLIAAVLGALMLACAVVPIDRARRRWRWRRGGRCGACGYDLRGGGGICPECGAGPRPVALAIAAEV
jgi:hypothetical protein